MLTVAEKQDLTRRYANGDLSMRDLRSAGMPRTIEVLSILADLKLRPPAARAIGPNLETRRGGMKRLQSALEAS